MGVAQGCSAAQSECCSCGDGAGGGEMRVDGPLLHAPGFGDERAGAPPMAVSAAAAAAPPAKLPPQREEGGWEPESSLEPEPPQPGAQSSTCITYDDSSTYQGQVREGLRHGAGLWQSRTGQYEGQWEQDMQHGRGRQVWMDGRVYEGEFRCGKFNGQGCMIWYTKKGLLRYEGQYENDLKHGHGIFEWDDGRRYAGEWHLGKRNGKGSYLNSQGEEKVGIWKYDRFDHWECEEQPSVFDQPVMAA